MYTKGVGDLRFVWHERKSAMNARKHGVAFAEAETVFLDDEALLIADPDHSDDEDRFVLLGFSAAEETMRTHYDFSKAKRNPYARRLKRQITIRLDEPTIAYFKSLAMDLDMPYQALINLYLRDCAATRRRLAIRWKPAA